MDIAKMLYFYTGLSNGYGKDVHEKLNLNFSLVV